MQKFKTSVNTDLTEDSYLINRKEKVSDAAAEFYRKRLCVISGKAGQGKTTFARLLTDNKRYKTVWYQITNSDRDPVYLCVSLYESIKMQITGYKSEIFDNIIRQNAQTITDYQKYIDLIWTSLIKINQDIVIVIDDTHLLPEKGLGFGCLQLFSSKSTQKVKTVICTRTGFDNKSVKESIHLDENYLKFDENEFKQLSNKHLAWLSDFSGLNNIQQFADGWVMGLRLIYEHMTENRKANIDDFKSIEDFLEVYFSSATQQTGVKAFDDLFYMLSFLNEIHLGFVSQIKDSEKIIDILEDMFNKNFFIQEAGDGRIRFHHMFKELLENKALSIFDKSDIHSFLIKAATFEASLGSITNALEYLSDAEAYTEIERTVKENFPALYASSNKSYLYEILQRIPDSERAKLCWVNNLLGTILQGIDPENTLPSFETAAKNALGDTLGLCVSYAGMIFYYYYIFGSQKNAEPLYEVIRENYHKLKDIHLVYDIMLCSALSQSGLYLSGAEDPTPYINRMKEYGICLDNINLSILTYSNQSIYAGVRSDVNNEKASLNTIYAHTVNPAMSLYFHFLLVTHIINYFAFKGKIPLLGDIINNLRTISMGTLVEYYLVVWKVDNLIATGKIEKAEAEFKHVPQKAPAPHLDTQISYYKALIYALKQDENAFKMIDQADRERAEAGGHEFFQCLNIQFKGIVYALMHKYEEAEKYLNTSLEIFSSSQLRACVYTYMTWIRHMQNKPEEAKKFAMQGAKELTGVSRSHFWGQTVDAFQCFLKYAAMNDETNTFAQQTAKEKYGLYIKDNYEFIPLLKIRSLGSLELHANDKNISCSELSQTSKVILSVLVCRNGNKCSVEEIMELLWPEASEKKARKSLDTAIARLRTLINKSLDIDSKQYIQIKNSMVLLENIVIDAPKFAKYTKQSITDLKNKNFIDSLENYLLAVSLYNGIFLESVKGLEIVDRNQHYYEEIFTELVCIGIEHSTYLKNFLDISDFLDKNIAVYIHNFNLVKTVINFYNKNSLSDKANKLVDLHRQYLESTNTDETEIDNIIFDLKI